MTPEEERLDQTLRKEVGMSLQEFTRLHWKTKIPLPAAFRGMMDGKEYLFEVKGRDEFYMTVQDQHLAEPVPKEVGHKLLQAILKQQEKLNGIPCEIDYGENNHDEK